MSTTPQSRSRGGYTGSTRNTVDNSGMLGAEFWLVGTEVLAIYNREFPTKHGVGREFMLVKPEFMYIKADQYGHCSPTTADDPAGKKITRFAMPPLAGFDMAYQDMRANGFDGFRYGDRVRILVTEIQKAQEFGFSDMAMFQISVDPR